MDDIALQDQLDQIRADIRHWQLWGQLLPEDDAVKLGLELQDRALDLHDELAENSP
jgi:hypothetical protein